MAKQIAPAGKIVVVEYKHAICPHCKKKIEHVDWRPFADGKIILIAHTECMKVLGTVNGPLQ